MNIDLFNKLMKQRAPAQHPDEWCMFLEICDMYLKKQGNKNPIVVELGILGSDQKKFYEQLFGAEYIGVDKEDKRSVPDVLGDSHSNRTLAKLKGILKGRLVDILFIDGDHTYNGVKKDYEMYAPLCSGIVAFHDIEVGRYRRSRGKMVWKFWDELKEEAYNIPESHPSELFLSIRKCRFKRKRSSRLGIGVMIRQ